MLSSLAMPLRSLMSSNLPKIYTGLTHLLLPEYWKVCDISVQYSAMEERFDGKPKVDCSVRYDPLLAIISRCQKSTIYGFSNQFKYFNTLFLYFSSCRGMKSLSRYLLFSGLFYSPMSIPGCCTGGKQQQIFYFRHWVIILFETYDLCMQALDTVNGR